MAQDIICRNLLSITIIGFPLLLLFAVMLVISQPAFSYTIETKGLGNSDKINDFELTYPVVSKNQQFHPLLVDDAVGEWKESSGVFVFPKIQNNEIVDVQYYYPPPYYLPPPPPYYLPPPPPPGPPPYYPSEDFVLIVRLIVDHEYMKDSMPDFWVYAGGEEEYIDGDEFEDDGKAKVTFVLDRDDLDYQEVVTMEAVDGRWDGSQYYYTNSNSYSVSWELLD